MSDQVNRPEHYARGILVKGVRIECVEFLDAFCPREPYIWQVVKYLWRRYLKGARLENLKKARWYLDKLIAKEESRIQVIRVARERDPLSLNDMIEAMQRRFCKCRR